MNLYETEVQFEDESMNFKLYHNLPQTFGLNIEGAIINWQVRTDEHTAESLKNYILSKMADVTVLTEKEVKQIQNDTKRKKRAHRR